MRFIALATLLPAALLLASSPSGAQQSTGEVAEQVVAGTVVEPPIIIDSDSNRYDMRSGLTRFSDNVSIQRGAMRVKADEGVVRQTDGRYTLIELFGSPTTWRDRLDDGTIVDGQADRIQYDVVDNVVTLTGNAQLRHERGEWTGDELVYDLDTESLAGHGTDGNQARVILESASARRSDSNETQPDSESETQPENDTGDDAANGTEEGIQDDDAAPPRSEEQDDGEQQPVDPPAGR